MMDELTDAQTVHACGDGGCLMRTGTNVSTTARNPSAGKSGVLTPAHALDADSLLRYFFGGHNEGKSGLEIPTAAEKKGHSSVHPFVQASMNHLYTHDQKFTDHGSPNFGLFLCHAAARETMCRIFHYFSNHMTSHMHRAVCWAGTRREINQNCHFLGP